jgi:hypothetical protein
MAEELRSIDVSEAPDLLALAEEVKRSGVPRLLRTDQEELAILVPVPKATKKRSRRARPLTREDSLFRLIGIGASETESDASERKHEILARAYLPRE